VRRPELAQSIYNCRIANSFYDFSFQVLQNGASARAGRRDRIASALSFFTADMREAGPATMLSNGIAQ